MNTRSDTTNTELASHADSVAHRVAFDPATESACEAVVLAVADVVDESPLRLPTLEHVVDTDALDSLLSATATSDDPAAASVTFDYADHRVQVTADGSVTVAHLDDSTAE